MVAEQQKGDRRQKKNTTCSGLNPKDLILIKSSEIFGFCTFFIREYVLIFQLQTKISTQSNLEEM